MVTVIGLERCGGWCSIVVGIYGERGSNDRLWVRKQMVVCRGDETGNGDYGFRLTRNGSGGPGGEWQGGAKMVL